MTHALNEIYFYLSLLTPNDDNNLLNFDQVMKMFIRKLLQDYQSSQISIGIF